jgi:hypothetical protein
MKAALNAIRKHKGLPEVDAMDFLTLVKDKARAIRSHNRMYFPCFNLQVKAFKNRLIAYIDMKIFYAKHLLFT